MIDKKEFESFQKKAFEDWYVLNAFDYEKNSLGSRNCFLQRKA